MFCCNTDDETVVFCVFFFFCMWNTFCSNCTTVDPVMLEAAQTTSACYGSLPPSKFWLLTPPTPGVSDAARTRVYVQLHLMVSGWRQWDKLGSHTLSWARSELLNYWKSQRNGITSDVPLYCFICNLYIFFLLKKSFFSCNSVLISLFSGHCRLICVWVDWQRPRI